MKYIIIVHQNNKSDQSYLYTVEKKNEEIALLAVGNEFLKEIHPDDIANWRMDIYRVEFSDQVNRIKGYA